jgi:hypothetical protein
MAIYHATYIGLCIVINPDITQLYFHRRDHAAIATNNIIPLSKKLDGTILQGTEKLIIEGHL